MFDRVFIVFVVLSILYQRGNSQLTLSKPNVNIIRCMMGDSERTITYDFRMAGSTIRYTMDGTMPDEFSLKYEKPIPVTHPNVLKAKVFHPDFLPSEVVTSTFVSPGIKIKSLKVTEPSTSYSGSGSKTLYDQVLGDGDFKSCYLGYNGQEVIISLKLFKEIKISKVKMSYLIHQGAWIFGPSIISVLDKAGRILKSEEFKDSNEQQTIENKIAEICLPLGKYRELTVKIKPLKSIPSWHQGADNPAWFFIDEIWLEK